MILLKHPKKDALDHAKTQNEKKSKAHTSISKYSFERRIFWAQAQLSSSIRSEVMKDKLRHIKITSNAK